MARDDHERQHESPVARLLGVIAGCSGRRPALTLALAGLLCAACIGYSYFHLGFKTDRSDLIDPRADYQKRWLSYTEQFGNVDDMVFVVESEQPEVIKQALDDLGGQLERETEMFANVQYKVDTTQLRHKGLQYQSPAELEMVLGRLEQLSPILRGRWNLFSLKQISQGIRYQLQNAQQAPDAAATAEPLFQQTRRLTSSLLQYVETNEFVSPMPDMIALDEKEREAATQARYFLNDKGTLGFLLVQPKIRKAAFEGAAESIDRARVLQREISERYPAATLGLTGIPVLESDEMRSSQESMFWASIISYLGVALLLAIGFRGLRHPLLAMLMLAIGMVWSFGFTALAVGHLNILSVSFVTILVGLGIDYAILYLSRYLEARHEGNELQPALVNSAMTVGPGILTGALTTALAFFGALFTDFQGVAELGIIAGGGVLLCAVASYTVMPALIALADRRLATPQLPKPFEGNALRQLVASFPVPIILGSLVMLAVVGLRGFNVKYDYNLLNLQADGLESVEVQDRIIEKSDSGLLFAVSVADSPQEALEWKRKFEALPDVHHVEELASYLPTYPTDETRLLVQAIHVQLAQLPDRMPEPTTVDPALIGKRMDELEEVLEQFDSPSAIQAKAELSGFLERLAVMPLEQQMEVFGEYQRRMTADLLGSLHELEAASDPEPVALTDLPAGLTSRFVSTSGHKWLLQVYPREQIWDIEPLTRFVNAVRSVDPEVTGTPLQNYEASGQIRASYETIAFYAIFAVFLMLLLDFLSIRDALLCLLGPIVGTVLMAVATRSLQNPLTFEQLIIADVLMTAVLVSLIDFVGLRNTVLAMLPPVAGASLMMGILGIIHVDLNAANLIVLPLIVGIGVDNGVHVMHDFRLQTGRYRTSASTVNSIVLTGLTTMVGFGSMMIARHRGLSSLGIVLTVGVGCSLFISLILVPSILTLLTRHRPDAGAGSDDVAPPQAPERRPGLSVFVPENAA